MFSVIITIIKYERGNYMLSIYQLMKYLRYQAGILGHSMTEMKAFFYFRFQYLKNKINCFTSDASNICKKSRSLQYDIL